MRMQSAAVCRVFMLTLMLLAGSLTLLFTCPAHGSDDTRQRLAAERQEQARQTEKVRELESRIKQLTRETRPLPPLPEYRDEAMRKFADDYIAVHGRFDDAETGAEREILRQKYMYAYNDASRRLPDEYERKKTEVAEKNRQLGKCIKELSEATVALQELNRRVSRLAERGESEAASALPEPETMAAEDPYARCRVSAAPDRVMPGDKVSVTYTGRPAFKDDLMTFLKAECPLGKYGEYYGMDKAVSGTLVFQAFRPGKYEARLYRHGGSELACRSNQILVEEPGRGLTLRPLSAKPGDQLVLSYAGITDKPGARVTLVLVEDETAAHSWQTTTLDGRTQGFIEHAAPEQLGDYEVRLFYYNPAGGLIMKDRSNTIRISESGEEVASEPELEVIPYTQEDCKRDALEFSQTSWRIIYRFQDKIKRLRQNQVVVMREANSLSTHVKFDKNTTAEERRGTWREACFTVADFINQWLVITQVEPPTDEERDANLWAETGFEDLAGQKVIPGSISISEFDLDQYEDATEAIYCAMRLDCNEMDHMIRELKSALIAFKAKARTCNTENDLLGQIYDEANKTLFELWQNLDSYYNALLRFRGYSADMAASITEAYRRYTEEGAVETPWLSERLLKAQSCSDEYRVMKSSLGALDRIAQDYFENGLGKVEGICSFCR